MTLMEAAQKWDLSTNWIRQLVKGGRIPGAKLRTDVPVPFYDIPNGAPKPKSMARSPLRRGTEKGVSQEAINRREYRAGRKPKPAKAKVVVVGR